MKSNEFFIRALIIPLLICISFFCINYYLDIYGIFGWENNPEKLVYGEERVAKYLKAHHYIPENFDGLLLGPSLSANIDPSGFTVANVYNASVIGGHVTSMLTLYEKAISNGGDFSTVIVCINPFVTGDYEQDNLNMKPADYWSAWGSYNLLKYYMLVLVRKLNLFPSKFPKDQFRPNGANYFEFRFLAENVEERIQEYASSMTEENFKINQTAEKELLQLAEMLHESGSEVLVYHHPLPQVLYCAHKKEFDEYWNRINQILNRVSFGFKRIEFNSPEYASFTGDVENYMDHWHLSTVGQEKFVIMVDSLLNLSIVNANN